MVKKIIWTTKAKNEFKDILQYWLDRNKSNAFSKKLTVLIIEELDLLSNFPQMGKPTDIPNIRVKIIHNYLLYYEVIDDSLYILTIRHGSRNQSM